MRNSVQDELRTFSTQDICSARLQAANNGFGFAGWAEALAACLTNLEDLRVGGASATDFDLLALRPMTNLTALDLSDSPDVSVPWKRI